MTLFVFGILFAVVAIAVLRVRSKAPNVRPTRETHPDGFDDAFALYKARPFLGVGAAACGLIAVLLIIWSSISQVGTGKVGVITTYGKVTSSSGSGLVFHAPWQKVTEMNVQNQRVHYNGFATEGDGTLKEGNNGILAFSSETQNVYVAATVNLHVDQAKAVELYRDTGTDYLRKLVDARVANFFKEETVKFPATQIAPQREEIRVAVKEKLAAELQPYGIVVTDLLIDNIGFDPAFEAAIVDKQVQTQKAQAAQAAVATAKAEADQKVKTKEGEAEQTRIAADAQAYKTKTEAAAQAEANAKLAASLTPALLQSQAIQAINPNLKVIDLPQGATIFNLGDLFAQP